MPLDQYNNLGSLVEPDRVHKACYADEQVFEKELENIFYKSWIYIGHESQVPNAGDYWTTWVGKERMILCRGENGDVNVLYNRCPHRGALICNNLNGNAPKAFRCPYHAWQFNMDGSLRNVPMKQGYEGVIDLTDPQLQMKRAEREMIRLSWNATEWVYASTGELVLTRKAKTFSANLGVQGGILAARVGAGGGDGPDSVHKRERNGVNHTTNGDGVAAEPCILRLSGRKDQREAPRGKGLDQGIRHVRDLDQSLSLLEVANGQTDRLLVVTCLQCKHSIEPLCRWSSPQAREGAGGIDHRLVSQKAGDDGVEVHAVHPI